ncbi:hypothetical protein B296_00041931 [Ensete ventricosum]|uniref:Uncharacterized protein n=1 Tax=Ensete ventricosum TaxID=4639 RepID=A0A426Z495_ENSVE|nr:hypothetical protein B296_00041931 [Ensete ventricosum]
MREDVPSPQAGEESPTGEDDVHATRGQGRREERKYVSSSSFFFSSSSFYFVPFSPSIDRQRSILVVPPGSRQFAYRSTAGPVRTGLYEVLPGR